MDGEVIEVQTKKHASIEDVNIHLLDKLDDLIKEMDGKDSEMIRAVTESIAKLNASLKGNNIFTPQETEEEKKEREKREVLQDILKG